MPDNKTTFAVGSQAIAVAGVAEQLAAQRIPQGHSVVLKARRTNTGYVYPGPTKAIAEANHFEMSPKDAISLHIDNMNAIWVDVSVNGEYVEWAIEAV